MEAVFFYLTESIKGAEKQASDCWHLAGQDTKSPWVAEARYHVGRVEVFKSMLQILRASVAAEARSEVCR